MILYASAVYYDTHTFVLEVRDHHGDDEAMALDTRTSRLAYGDTAREAVRRLRGRR